MAKIKKTARRSRPASIEIPATPLAPKIKAKRAKIKNAIAALSIVTP